MDAASQLRKSDCALRIRQQVIGNESSALMTFKGPRSDSKFKARPEYETVVANAETAQTIFESLGYRKAIIVEKKRSMWSLDGCEVCLDELPHLGCFVEVEGPCEEVITGVLEKLGLHKEPHISKGYAAMMARKLKQE
jgi:adenylate cyclase class 2